MRGEGDGEEGYREISTRVGHYSQDSPAMPEFAESVPSASYFLFLQVSRGLSTSSEADLAITPMFA